MDDSATTARAWEVSIPNVLPAAPGDIAVEAMSRMLEMHLGSRLAFDGHLDSATLCRATRLLLDVEPVLGCWLEVKALSARWVRCARLNEESYFTTVETDDPDAEYAAFHGIPFESKGPRLAVRLVRSPGGDEVCIRFDHGAGDGWSAMEVTHLLAETYSRLLADPDYAPEPRLTPRPTHDDVWQALTDDQREAAQDSIPFRGQQWRGRTYSGPGAGFEVRTSTLPTELVAAVREYAHQRNGTVNDAIVASLLRSMASFCPVGRNSRPGVSVSADTRRLVPDGRFDRICLLATTQTVEIEYRDGESFEQTLQHVTEAVRPHKECLWSISGNVSGIGKAPTAPIALNGLFRTVTALMRILHLVAPVTMNLGPFDETRLVFGDLRPVSAYASGVIPRYAGFPLTISSYRGAVTLWAGFRQERIAPDLIERCLDGMSRELVDATQAPALAKPALPADSRTR